MQNEIAASAYQYQKDIESGKKIIVGVNKYVSGKKVNLPAFKVDDNIRLSQIEKIKQLKAERNNEEVIAKLTALKTAAKSNDNLMPHILSAVEEYATLGEIADTLREVFGEY